MKALDNMNTVKDALYYIHEQSGASDEKVSGVIVGLMAGLMACGYKFEDVIRYIRYYVKHHPESKDFRSMRKVLPECWLEEYSKNDN